MFGALIAWKRFGNEPVGNVLLFWLWLSASMGILAGLSKPTAPTTPKSAARFTIEALSAVALTVALAWYGYFVTGAFFTLGQLSILSYRTQFDDAGNPIHSLSCDKNTAKTI
jgi:hypothetical protein